MKRLLFPLVVTTFIFTFGLLAVREASAAGAAGVDILPVASAITVGEQVTLTVVISNATTAVHGFQLQLGYDAAVLTPVAVKPKTNWIGANGRELVCAQPLVGGGQIGIACATTSASCLPGVRDSGAIVELVFAGVGEGSADISIDNATLTGVHLPVGTLNIITPTGATVTVGVPTTVGVARVATQSSNMWWLASMMGGLLVCWVAVVLIRRVNRRVWLLVAIATVTVGGVQVVMGSIPSTNPTDADLDGSGIVDATDLQLIADSWLCQTGDACYDADYDFNGNGVIELLDMTQVGNGACALDAMCVGVDGKSGSGVVPGDALRRVTLNHPAAVCNDGTPAVFYIRPAAETAFEDVWAFHFQGGGACSSQESCEVRYCGTEKYNNGKFSSAYAANTKQGDGIFSQAITNSLRSVNQVFVYYCSSDGWTGRNDDVTLVSDNGLYGTTYQFHGHDIISATFSALMNGETSDDGTVTIGRLDEATEVLVTGTSAGSGGVVHHLDFIAAMFPPTQTNVAGIIDAGTRPLPDDYSGAFAITLTETLLDRYHSGFLTATNGFLDQSCDAMTTPDDRWLCAQNAYVESNHLTTPFFIRMDLRDSLMKNDMVSLGASVPAVANAVRTRLNALTTIQTTAVESSTIGFTPGVYGPNCGQHVGLTDDDWYMTASITATNGTAVTLHDAIQSWLGGTYPGLADTHPASRSLCVEANDKLD